MHTALLNLFAPRRRGTARKVRRTGLLLLLSLAGMSCRGTREPPPAAKASPAKPAPAKITQFYASPPAVEPGGQALLCYGVENARAVRVTPSVDGVRPSYSRCVPVTPRTSTTYTLTAEGEDGGTAAAVLTLRVARGAAPQESPPAPARQTSGPVITAFRAEKRAGLTLLCYAVEGADAVAVEPQVLPRSGAISGCLGVAPRAPTTYTLIAYGPGGRTVRRTLEVSP